MVWKLVSIPTSNLNMPGLLNPMIFMNSQLEQAWSKILNSIAIEDAKTDIQDILMQSPLDEIDILKVTKMLIFFEVPKQYILNYFLARGDIPPQIHFLINDYFELQDIQLVLELHNIL